MSTTRLTRKARRVKKESGEVVLAYQIKAIKDFSITILEGKNLKTKRIKKGTLGGYAEACVNIADYAWVDQETILLGKTNFSGVTCGYARIENSDIGIGTIISGKAIISDSSIGEFVTISGHTSLKKTKVLDESIIVGTPVRNSKIGYNVTIKCAGAIDNAIIRDGETRTW